MIWYEWYPFPVNRQVLSDEALGYYRIDCLHLWYKSYIPKSRRWNSVVKIQQSKFSSQNSDENCSSKKLSTDWNRISHNRRTPVFQPTLKPYPGGAREPPEYDFNSIKDVVEWATQYHSIYSAYLCFSPCCKLGFSSTYPRELDMFSSIVPGRLLKSKAVELFCARYRRAKTRQRKARNWGCQRQ